MVEGEKVVRKESVLVVDRARLEIRRNFYSIRAAKGWNELPENVKSSTSINGFKSAYDKWRETTNSNTNTDDARSNREQMDSGNR